VPPLPWLRWIRRYCPGWSAPLRGVICCASCAKFPVSVALAYWTDHPASEMASSMGLNSSMKSCVYEAPNVRQGWSGQLPD
jgi:hypothetical protein